MKVIKKTKNSFGFSMTELLVTIAIISIVSAISIPNMISWRSNQGVRLAANDFADEFMKAKMAAIKSNTTCTITISESANTCSFTCMNDKTISLSDYTGGVSFGGPSGESSLITINYAFNGISDASGSIFLKNSTGTKYYRILISFSGSVSTQKWSGSAWV